MAEDYGEPWSIGEVTPDNLLVSYHQMAKFPIKQTDGSRVDFHSHDRKFLEHIVACVNACRGIPTQELVLATAGINGDITKLMQHVIEKHGKRTGLTELIYGNPTKPEKP